MKSPGHLKQQKGGFLVYLKRRKTALEGPVARRPVFGEQRGASCISGVAPDTGTEKKRYAFEGHSLRFGRHCGRSCVEAAHCRRYDERPPNCAENESSYVFGSRGGKVKAGLRGQCHLGPSEAAPLPAPSKKRGVADDDSPASICRGCTRGCVCFNAKMSLWIISLGVRAWPCRQAPPLQLTR